MDIYPSCRDLASALAPLYAGDVEHRGRMRIDMLENTLELDTVCPMYLAMTRHEPALCEPEFLFSCTVNGEALVDFLQSSAFQALLVRACAGTTKGTAGAQCPAYQTEEAKKAVQEIRELIRTGIDLNDDALVKVTDLSEFFDMEKNFHHYWGDDETLDEAVAEVKQMFEAEIEAYSGRLIIEKVDLREEFLSAALNRFNEEPGSRHLYRSHIAALVEAGDIDQEDADEWQKSHWKPL